LVETSPQRIEPWIHLALLTRDAQQARTYIHKALALDPHNREARAVLRQLDRQPSTHTTVSTGNTFRRQLRRWLGIWLLTAVLIIVLGGFVGQAWATKKYLNRPTPTLLAVQLSPTATPTVTATATPSVTDRVQEQLPELESAWAARDWARAAGVLDQVTQLDSTYPGLVEAQCDTYLHWGRDLAAQDQVRRAYNLYRHGQSICPEHPALSKEVSLASTYLSGLWKQKYKSWQAATQDLQIVYDLRPEYAAVSTHLYTSHIAHSRMLLAQNHLGAAKAAAQSALSLHPDGKEALDLLDQIQVRLSPTPTPIPAPKHGKRIEINISTQRMYVWQGETLLYEWVCSTGEPGRDTVAGHYQILDKIPEAWASTWSLRMPYWMGIYWAGSLENGIHALPINPDGSHLWAGYLGTRVSYGCVILSTENARTLYNWATVGTPVWIHY
jgi:tetratricopeptide (TPR) repeat protein